MEKPKSLWHMVIYAPAFNVAKNLPELIARMKKAADELANSGVSLDAVLFINDGSTDNTMQILDSFKGKIKFIRAIHKADNQGPVKALFDGMEEVVSYLKKNHLPDEKTIIIRMDSDLEHQPEDIANLIAPIISGRADVSVGYMVLGTENGILTKWFNESIGRKESRRFLGVVIPQFCPGFNAVRADLFKKLHPVLKDTAKKFERETGKEMLSIDFIILVLARHSGGRLNVSRLSPLQKNQIKKTSLAKLATYWGCHMKTISFLEKEKYGV